MNDFIYDIPTKIYFGKHQEEKIGEILKEYNPKKVLIHFGKRSVIDSGLLSLVTKKLNEVNIPYVLLGGVLPNPNLALVREGIELAKKENVDFILAIGGGSVMDSAKDIANGLANPDVDVWEFSLGNKKPTRTINKGAILTISASGSEMSDSCVISDLDNKEKRGYSSPFNRFNFAIENPELTYSVNKYQTACGIVDISMHTIERYFDLGSSSISEDIALSLIKNVFTNGKIAFNNPTDYEARANLMWASSLAHNGLTGCGKEFMMPVHQLEHELSAFDSSIAHGAGLSALWSSYARIVFKSNIPLWKKYSQVVWDINFDEVNDIDGINLAINKQEEYYKSINMPTSLKELGISEDNLIHLANRCSRNKSRIIKGDYPLDYKEILKIYTSCYHNHE